MTPEEFEKELIILAETYINNPECFHELSDELMCNVLRALGYNKGIDIIESIEHWYS